MMKMLVLGLIFCLPLCLVGEAQDLWEIEIQVSPQTIVLGSETVWVTVHTNMPYSRADRASLTLNGIDIAWTKSDLQGYLVAKFNQADVKEIVVPPSIELVLEGVTGDGIPFAGSVTVRVVEGGPKK